MMFIPLTRDAAFWEMDKKILFIEDFFWMSQNSEMLQRYSYEIFDVDFDELGVDEDAMWLFAMRLVDMAADMLNQYNKVSFSRKYWQRVLFPWLRNFVPALYLRFYRLLALRQKYPQENFEALVFDEAGKPRILLNAEVLEQMEGEEADFYGWHLYSLILNRRNFNIKLCMHSAEKYMGESAEETSKHDMLQEKQGLIKRIWHRLKNPYAFLKAVALYAMDKIIPQAEPARVEMVLSDFGNRSLALKLKCKSLGKVEWLPSDKPVWIQEVKQSRPIQWELRGNLTEILRARMGHVSDCQEVLMEVFFKEMPCSFLENFEACRSLRRWQYEKFPHLKYIISSAGAAFTESKLALAEQGEQGVKFSFVTHGGIRPSRMGKFGFGEVLSDVYYAWGSWGNDIDKNIMNCRVAPAEKLYLYDRLSAKKSADILYVGDWVSTVLHKLSFHTMGRILQKEKIFLKNLEAVVRENVIMRNYPVTAASLLDRWLKYAFPDIRISRESDKEPFRNETFVHKLMGSRLCIFDHFETPFLEALYANKPFLLYFDKDFSHNYFDPDTEREYVKLMEEAGILQYGPEAAAKYLNEIYPQIETWWQEPRRQEIVRILQERYTGKYVDAEKWWEKEIMGLLKGEIAW